MSISALLNDSSITSLTELYGTLETGSVSSSIPTDTTETAASILDKSDSLDISGPGEMFSKLQELAESDPEKFKEICSDIADKLKSAAENQTGKDAETLTDMAEKFENTAESGDASDLKPQGPPPTPPSGGAQGAVNEYSQNQDEAKKPGSAIRDLMSGIFAEVNAAVG